MFSFNGNTHVVQLGVSRPNGNKTNNDGTPVIPHMNPTRPNGHKTVPMKFDTFNFMHGNKIVKSIQLAGQQNSSINVNSLVPNDYNVNSGTSFTFNGSTHTIQLGINRPNGNKQSDNGRPIIPQLNNIDTIKFMHGNQLVKQVNQQGKIGTQFSLKNLLPTGYNVSSVNNLTYDGKVHVVQVGVNRPNNNLVQTDKNGNVIKPTIAKDTMTVEYLNADNDRPVRSQDITATDASSFDLAPYLLNVPKGYYLDFNDYEDGIMDRNGVNNKFIYGHPVIKIAVKQNPVYHPVNTIKFMHGSKIVKVERKSGKQGDKFNVNSDIPTGYNVNSNIEFTFNGGTNVVNLGINRPNGNQVVPVQEDVIDKVEFVNNGNVIKTISNTGIDGNYFNVSKEVPSGYNTNNINLIHNGTTHIINLNSNVPNIPSTPITPIVPSNIIPNKPNNNNNNKPIKPITPTPKPTPNFIPGHHHKKHNLKRVNNINRIKAGTSAMYKSHKVTNISNKDNLFYIYNLKGIQLHHDILRVGEYEFGAVKIRRNSGFTIKIKRVFKVDGHVRYEVNYGGKDYFITGNKKFTRNAYIQPSEFRANKHHKYMTVRVKRDACLYKSFRYNHKTLKGYIRRGSKARVVSIKKLGKDEFTRMRLSNGLVLTANKNFVNII